VAIDEGATYKIKGEIEGVGQFEKKLRSVAAGQDMPIYVPHELKARLNWESSTRSGSIQSRGFRASVILGRN
jgi:hypothetical protein